MTIDATVALIGTITTATITIGTLTWRGHLRKQRILSYLRAGAGYIHDGATWLQSEFRSQVEIYGRAFPENPPKPLGGEIETTRTIAVERYLRETTGLLSKFANQRRDVPGDLRRPVLGEHGQALTVMLIRYQNAAHEAVGPCSILFFLFPFLRIREAEIDKATLALVPWYKDPITPNIHTAVIMDLALIKPDELFQRVSGYIPEPRNEERS